MKRNPRIDKFLHLTNRILENENTKGDYQSLKTAAVLVDMMIRTAVITVDKEGEVVLDHRKGMECMHQRGGRIRQHAYDVGLHLLLHEDRKQVDVKKITNDVARSAKMNEQMPVQANDDVDDDDNDAEEEASNEQKEEDAKLGLERALFIDRIVTHKRQKNLLRLHEKVFKYTDSSFHQMEASLARHVPMVVMPRKWASPVNGGYLQYPSVLVRPVGSEIQKKAVKSSRKEMNQLYDCVSVLGMTPWVINKEILQVVEELWNKGGGLAEVPSRSDLQLPDASMKEEKGDAAYYRACAKTKQLNYDRHGLRCTFQYKLEIANTFKQFDQFYFPHNLDFRGRAYPIPPHFNHIGPDLDRGLLKFSVKKPLGHRGLFWMKVHLANLFGNNKISFLDRAAWTEAHLPQAMDSAENPLNGSRWWAGADDPWQALATCMELKEVLGVPQSKRHMFMSGLPIHMDGSCNGLQHYAALGGDIDGGTQVNLVPGSAPRDVYTAVSNIVARRVAEDAEQGHEIALILNGKVERKIVKQTVMTSVYGVTYVGARQQIQNALEDRVKLEEDQYWKCSSYLARLTFESIRELFSGARDIMDWLGTCAYLIAKSGRPVRWTTPLHLPVVQPYRQTRRAEFRTALQVVKMIESSDSFPINSRKQRSAFPPNYVHSLDSTHMMMTAMAMHNAGLTFAAVHDSFWTHACDIDRMNIILRNEFKSLHEQSLLDNLRQEFELRYPDVIFPPLPKRGELDLTNVLHSPYFFH